MHIHQSTVSRIVRRYNDTEEYKRRSDQRRRRCTTIRDDRYLRIQSLRNCAHTATKLRNYLLVARWVNVTAKTVIRRLNVLLEFLTSPTSQHRMAALRKNSCSLEWASVKQHSFHKLNKNTIMVADRRHRVNRRSGYITLNAILHIWALATEP